MARIIYERGLSGTSLGTLALAAGSIDDGAAWCMLALVLASFSGDPMIAILAIGGGTLYPVTQAQAGGAPVRSQSRHEQSARLPCVHPTFKPRSSAILIVASSMKQTKIVS